MAANDTDTLGSTPLVPKKAGNPLIPVIAVVVLVPVLCYGVMDFVIIPKLKSVAGSAPAAAAAPAHGTPKKKEGGGHGGKEEAAKDADFGIIMVNLSGSGSSRYLRTNIFIKSNDPKIADIIKENHPALRDAAITVLSAQTPAGLENNGRDIVRKALISQFNRVLGGEVVDQIYFSEFVIQ
jgi:flagellar basal body-associated protein FliL